MAGLTNWKKSVPLQQQKNPFSSIQNALARAMDEFYHAFPSPFSSTEDWESLALSPSIDIIEDKDNYKIEAEMPGMGPDDIKVSISDGLLTIVGEKTTSKKDHNKNYISREISYGSYRRSITLPDYADVSQAKASFKKGMLWVTVPKKEAAKSSTHSLKIEHVEESASESEESINHSAQEKS